MTREIQQTHLQLPSRLSLSMLPSTSPFQFTTSKYTHQNSHPFFPPFLRDSAGVLGGEGERLLFLPAELALRSLRSGVREDWSDKPRAAEGARDGGWEKEQQNERMERLHTQGREAVEERGREGSAVVVEGTIRAPVICPQLIISSKSDCCSPCIDRLKKLFELKWVLQTEHKAKIGLDTANEASPM